MSLLEQVKQLSMTATEHNHDTSVVVRAIGPVIDEVISAAANLGLTEQASTASGIKSTLEEVYGMLDAVATKLEEVTTAAEQITST